MGREARAHAGRPKGPKVRRKKLTKTEWRALPVDTRLRAFAVQMRDVHELNAYLAKLPTERHREVMRAQLLPYLPFALVEATE